MSLNISFNIQFLNRSLNWSLKSGWSRPCSRAPVPTTANAGRSNVSRVQLHGYSEIMRVMSKFHFTDPTRPDPQTAVVDLSAQSRHVRTVSVDLVRSGLRQSPWVRVVEFRNDTVRPDQRQSLVWPLFTKQRNW